MSDEESMGNICELYNVWFCIVELKNYERKYHGIAERKFSPS